MSDTLPKYIRREVHRETDTSASNEKFVITVLEVEHELFLLFTCEAAPEAFHFVATEKMMARAALKLCNGWGLRGLTGNSAFLVRNSMASL